MFRRGAFLDCSSFPKRPFSLTSPIGGKKIHVRFISTFCVSLRGKKMGEKLSKIQALLPENRRLKVLWRQPWSSASLDRIAVLYSGSLWGEQTQWVGQSRFVPPEQEPLLFVFGGWGWLGYRGQAGPSKIWISPQLNSLYREEGAPNGLHKKPCRIWSSQLVVEWFNPVGYIIAETQIDIEDAVKSSASGFSHSEAQKRIAGVVDGGGGDWMTSVSSRGNT